MQEFFYILEKWLKIYNRNKPEKIFKLPLGELGGKNLPLILKINMQLNS